MQLFIYLVYQALYLILAPFVLFALFLRQDTAERVPHFLGNFKGELDEHILFTECDWFHAVSYGETVLVLEFIKQGIESKNIESPIFFTTTIEDALKLFNRDIQEYTLENKLEIKVNSAFLPLDFHPIMSKFLDQVNPRRFFLAETDFWPSLLLQLGGRKTQIFLVNGRISEKLCSFYENFGSFTSTIFNKFTECYVQYRVDSMRLERMGLTRTQVMGNAKFDLLREKPTLPYFEYFTKNERDIIVLGSFHLDEYKEFLPFVERLEDKALIIVVPRKLDQVEEMAKATYNAGVPHELFSNQEELASYCKVLIVDKMGLLASIYQISEFAIIGGSFNQVGGHNFLEPLLYKRPTFVGPEMRNYSSDVEKFKSQGMIWQAKDFNDLFQLISKYFEAPRKYFEGGIRAYDFIEQNQGALRNTWYEIQGY